MDSANYLKVIIPVRLSDEDIRRSEAAVQKFKQPRGKLIREAWRQWLDSQPDEAAP